MNWEITVDINAEYCMAKDCFKGLLVTPTSCLGSEALKFEMALAEVDIQSTEVGAVLN